MGFLYIFGAAAIYFVEKKKNIINRILRLSPANNPSVSKSKNQKGMSMIDLWLAKNNIKLDAKEAIISIFVLSSFLFLIGLFFKFGLFFSILFSVTIFFIIFIFTSWRRKMENIKKEDQMEQFLLDLIGNLYGNPNILNSIQKTSEEAPYPLKSEFEIVVDDTKKGLLLNDALKNMIKRNSSQIIEIVLLGLIAANDKGADLIEFLKNQVEYIREKKGLENYIKILSSGPKYTSYLIMVIPLISMAIVALVNKYFLEILMSAAGYVFLIYAAASYTAGFLIINKITSFIGGSRVLK